MLPRNRTRKPDQQRPSTTPAAPSTVPSAALAAEIRANLRSICQAQEAGALGDGAPMLCLRALAAMGHDVYCYASGGDGVTTGTWCVWLGPLAADTHGAQGRVTCAEWRARFVELLAAMGWRDDAEGEAQP